jgi:ribosome-associated toxin RatA of RatAB toxin-antitoxin module
MMRLVVVPALCVSLGWATGAQAAIAIDTAADARLAAGEVLVEAVTDETEGAARVSAVIDIGAAPDQVWAVMTDCARAPKFVPDLVSCRILESDPKGAWDVREHIIDWAWFLPKVRNVFRSDYEPPRVLRFRRVDGDMARSEGEWRLEALNGGRTRLSYMALLSPKSWIPPSLALSSVKEDVPKILLALRRECTGAK